MLQLTPQSRIFLALAPVDFRKGIDGLAAVCRRTFAQNPLDGALYVFRNRTGTTLKILYYDTTWKVIDQIQRLLKTLSLRIKTLTIMTKKSR